MNIYNLSPSDFTFTWDGCKRCFYLKVKHNIGYRGPFLGMFGKMGDLTSNYYLDKPSSEISPELPAGVVKFREKWVKSIPNNWYNHWGLVIQQILINCYFYSIIAKQFIGL